MELKVSTSKAIQILKRRLSEIGSFDFEPSSWKGKTENDLKEIFGILDSKHSQIALIQFTTPVTDAKRDVLERGKKQARQYLESYIEFIEEYSVIEKEKNLEVENSLQKEVLGLKGEVAYLVSEKQTLLNNQEMLLKDNKAKASYISKLEKNTVQLTDLTLKKIFDLIQNLPMKHSLYLIGLLAGLIGSSFLLGQKWEGIVKNNDEVELKQNYNRLVEENKKMSDSIAFLNTELKKKKIEVITKRIPNDKVRIVMFNTLDTGIAIDFENVSKNKNKVRSHGTSIHPNEFATIDLDIANYRWVTRKFIDIKKSAETEKSIYKESIIRIDSTERFKQIKID